MTFIPTDSTHLTVALQNDLQYWRSVISWAKERYQAYNQTLTTQVMTNLGITTADQNAILSFVGDLNRFIQLSEGTIPSSATDMLYDIQAILGVV
jgi:hypothetical protein